MSDVSAKDTHAKALAIHLDPSIYGSFAEIGGGQEVARWFLSVGAASGTVAQTISAYDKTFSDETYGAGTRYVSRERVVAMLDHEYNLLVERLGPSRGAEARFFAFADTVATRNFKGDNEQHGWIGMRFQGTQNGHPSDLLLHVNLRDSTARQQQEALGMLGVNVIYSAFYARASADDFLKCLWGGLSIERMGIDVLDFSGPAFARADAKAWCLQLLRRRMACAIALDADSQVVEPASVLRKRPLLVDRGRFKSVDPFHAAMLNAAKRTLANEGLPLGRDPLPLLELSLVPVNDDDTPDDAAVLTRTQEMLKVAPVLVSELSEGHQLIPYLRRFTAEPIRMVGGMSQLARILLSEFYGTTPFSLLERLGKFFAQDVKYYAYPMPRDAVAHTLAADPAAGNVRLVDSAAQMVGVDDFILAPPANHLYRYLRETGWVVPIELQ